jgi:hypothetical protein
MEEELPLNIMTLDALGQGQRVLGGFLVREFRIFIVAPCIMDSLNLLHTNEWTVVL